MKDRPELLKLQAYLDGELDPKDAPEVAKWLETQPEDAALFAELRDTRQALREFDQAIKLPESREFYWSKIERAIQRQDVAVGAPDVVMPLWLTRLRRLLAPAGGLALLAIIGLLATQSSRFGSGSVETAFSDPGALTYRDYTSGTTLVWLSYPAENELALDEDEGTLQ
jgi:anti-sigma factor RsiW